MKRNTLQLGNQQMNQAGSENKHSKRVSYECFLNNYNFDDVSTDQNRVCESVVGGAEREAKSQQQQQRGSNLSCQQSLLQKVWVHLQSIITAHMNGCPRCNSKPRPVIRSFSENSILSYLSSTASPPIQGCKQPCTCISWASNPSVRPLRVDSPSSLNEKPSCPNVTPSCPSPTPSSPSSTLSCPSPTPSCPNAKPACPNAKPACPNAKPACPNAKPGCPNAKPACPNAKPACPNAEPSCPNLKPSCPNAKPSCPSAKPSLSCPNAKPSCPGAEPSCPNIKPGSPNVKTSCTNTESPKPKPLLLNAKTSYPNVLCPNAKPSCPNAEPSCPNAKPSCPNAEPLCPNLKPSCPEANPSSSCPNSEPPCPNAKPACSSAKPSLSCPNAKPSCPNAEPSCPNLKPTCPNANPSSPCPEAKPICPNAVSVCPNSKTKLYHSFSNESLSSTCKEDLVEMARAYLHKIASSHKIKCPRCSKQPAFSPMDTIRNYVQNMLEHALDYLKTSSQKSCPPPCATCCSRSCKKFHPNTSRVCCVTSQTKCPITQSFGSLRFPKSDICPKRLISPPRQSQEQGTHEHKSCATSCHKKNSQSVQPSFNLSDTSCWSSIHSDIRSRHIKTPHSVEELKASVTGIGLDKISGNLLGCEVLDFRSTIEYPKSCLQALSVPKDSICSTDEPTPHLGLNLPKERKVLGYDPHFKDCKHPKESLGNCEKPLSPCVDPKEAEGRSKSDERYRTLLDKEFGGKPREQLHAKETISEAGRNSITSVESIQPNHKDCNSQEKDAHGSDPHNYRYYY